MEPILPKRTILYSTHGSKHYLPPVNFSDHQIICGPYYPTVGTRGNFRSINTAAGEYDLQETCRDLAPSERPDLIIVRADASRQNWPRNVNQFTAQTVLVLGDTHHLKRPISGLLKYAMDENFDHILFDYNRQHAHFFVEAGFSNARWLPGFNVQRYHSPQRRSIEHAFTFVGQMGSYHRYRRQVIDALLEKGIPLKTLTCPPHETQEIQSKSLLSLNVSLNGDLNQRVLEIIGSGSLCITDRLQPQSGLGDLFSSKTEIITYTTPEDLTERLRHFANTPAEALRIAKAGLTRFNNNYTTPHMVTEFEKILQGQPGNPLFCLTREKRTSNAQHKVTRELEHRITLYEFAQSLHAENSALLVHFSAGVDPLIATDMADLPRCSLSFSNRSPSQSQQAVKRRVEPGQIRHVCDSDRLQEPVHLFVTCVEDILNDSTCQRHLENTSLCASVLLSDCTFEGSPNQGKEILTNAGLNQNPNHPYYWSRGG